MRALILGLVGLLWVGVAGCDGAPEEDDDDGPSSSSRCEDICLTVADCEGLEVNVDACVQSCVADASQASATCVRSFEDITDCATDVGLDCDAVSNGCANEAEDWIDDCEVDFERTFETLGLTPPDPPDPPPGTCTNTCIDAFDGFCDEPEGTGICTDGTDAGDCGCV
jgi:hypothetical protein